MKSPSIDRRSARVEVAARRKIVAGATASLALARQRAGDALNAYRGVRFEAMVFDLDGTLADANAARADVRAALARLIRGGVQIAIATGRAPSEHALRLMRGLVIEKHWDRVLIGYRNGAELSRLDTDAVEILSPLAMADFAALRDLLTAQLPALGPDVLLVADMPAQITLRAAHSRFVEHPDLLVTVAREAIAAAGARAKALQSGHSVDIVHLRTSKGTIASLLAGDGHPVLRFGDTGMHSGNDFELLADPHGLSVDHVSADLGGCWNFLPDSIALVEGTLHYLEHLDLTGEGTVTFGAHFFG